MILWMSIWVHDYNLQAGLLVGPFQGTGFATMFHFCSLRLKLFTKFAETVSPSNLFDQEIVLWLTNVTSSPYWSVRTAKQLFVRRSQWTRWRIVTNERWTSTLPQSCDALFHCNQCSVRHSSVTLHVLTAWLASAYILCHLQLTKIITGRSLEEQVAVVKASVSYYTSQVL